MAEKVANHDFEDQNEWENCLNKILEKVDIGFIGDITVN